MDFDIKVIADSQKWKELLLKIRNPLIVLASFDYEKGNTLSFATFLKMFKLPEQKLPYEAVHQ